MGVQTLLGTRFRPTILITVKAMMFLVHLEAELYKSVADKLALCKALGYLDKLLYVGLLTDNSCKFYFRFKQFEQEDLKNVGYIFSPNAYLNFRDSCDEEKLSKLFNSTAEAFFEYGDTEAMLYVGQEGDCGITKSVEKGNYEILDYATMTSMPPSSSWRDE